MPVAFAIPTARNEADRSSTITCISIRGSATIASAIGVERDPGETTALVIPARTHSSSIVAQNVAWTWAGVAETLSAGNAAMASLALLVSGALFAVVVLFASVAAVCGLFVDRC